MPLRTNPWERRKRAGPVISGPTAPRPARSPNPAAAVVGGGVSLTGEERLLSFRDPHMVSASELGGDPVFRFQSSIRSAAQLAQAGMGAEASQIPTNYQMQQLGTGTVVSRRGGSIRTPEWEQGDKLRRAWERSEYALGQAVRAGDEGNLQLHAAVIRARQNIAASQLFEVEGSAEDIGKPFFAYQRQADGTSILPAPEQAVTPTEHMYIGRGSEIQKVPRISSRQRIEEAGGRAEFGQTAFTRTAAGPGYGTWQARAMTTTGEAPAGARPSREERVATARARAEQIGVPPGTKQIVGPHKELTNLLRQAKTPKEKDAALKRMERRLGGKWDLSTHKGYMAAKQAQFKRGAKKRLDRHEQQSISDALDGIAAGNEAEALKRLMGEFGSAVLKNPRWQKMRRQLGLTIPKEKGTQRAAKKAATEPEVRSITTMGKHFLELHEEYIEATQDLVEGGQERQPFDVIEAAEKLWQWQELAGVSRQDFDRKTEAALGKISNIGQVKDLLGQYQAYQKALRPQGPFAYPIESQPTPQAPEAAPIPQAAAQPPQGARMGTSPVVGLVTSTPPGMPDFPEDMSFFKPKHDDSGSLYDEQAGVTMTITKDGRRYWTHVVMRGGKQVSQTYELEGGGPPPNFGQEAEAAAGGAAPAGAPSPQDKQKQIDAFIKQAIGAQ